MTDPFSHDERERTGRNAGLCIHPEGYDGECPCPPSCDCCKVTAATPAVDQLRADANAWRRKAIRRALAISRLRGTIDACIDLADEKITDPGPRGDGYREAIGDLREVLREFGHLDGDGAAATEATEPAPWLLAGTRDARIPEQHRFTVHPVDPELERAATERARQVADEAQRASEQLAALNAPHTGLVVQPYRNDAGQPAWVFRCWGTDHCDGYLSLDHSSQQSAERARDRHLAEGHAIAEPAQDGGPTVADCARADRNWDLRKAGE